MQVDDFEGDTVDITTVSDEKLEGLRVATRDRLGSIKTGSAEWRWYAAQLRAIREERIMRKERNAQ
jgi:hypothetical protein